MPMSSSSLHVHHASRRHFEIGGSLKLQLVGNGMNLESIKSEKEDNMPLSNKEFLIWSNFTQSLYVSCTWFCYYRQYYRHMALIVTGCESIRADVR